MLGEKVDEKNTFEPPKEPVNKGKTPAFADAHPSWLPRKDDVRTYAAGKHLRWHLLAKEILLHVMACEKECRQLKIQLDNLFRMTSEYQKQVA